MQKSFNKKYPVETTVSVNHHIIMVIFFYKDYKLNRILLFYVENIIFIINLNLK